MFLNSWGAFDILTGHTPAWACAARQSHLAGAEGEEQLQAPSHLTPWSLWGLTSRKLFLLSHCSGPRGPGLLATVVVQLTGRTMP